MPTNALDRLPAELLTQVPAKSCRWELLTRIPAKSWDLLTRAPAKSWGLMSSGPLQNRVSILERWSRRIVDLALNRLGLFEALFRGPSGLRVVVQHMAHKVSNRLEIKHTARPPHRKKEEFAVGLISAPQKIGIMLRKFSKEVQAVRPSAQMSTAVP
jgi:hypothetical protein